MHLTLNDRYYDNSTISIAMFVSNAVYNDSRVVKTAQTLKKLGYNITIYGFGNVTEPTPLDKFNFPVIYLPNPNIAMKTDGSWYNLSVEQKWEKYTSIAAATLAQVLKSQDVSILHTHDMIGLTVGGKLYENHNLKTKKWVHDIHEYVEGLTEISDEARAFYLAQEVKYIHQPDHLSTVSPALADYIKKSYQLSRAPSVILNAPRSSDFEKYSQDVRSVLKLPDDTILLAYAGNVKKIRGVDIIIDALDEIDDAHLVILSNSENDYRKELEAMIARKGLIGRVHFLPYVPFYAVTSFLRCATIGIHPIRAYPNSQVALPNKLFEYLHAGLPVISSDVEAMHKFITRYDCGMTFSDGNASSLAQAVKAVLARMAENPTWPETFSALAEAYSWEKQERILAEAYESLQMAPNSLADKTDDTLSVLHLPTSAAGQPSIFAENLVARGHKASSLSRSSNEFNYASDISFESTLRPIDLMTHFETIINDYNVLHYHSLPLVFLPSFNKPTAIDLLFSKLRGKKLFYHFRGSEIRMQSIFYETNKFHYIDDEWELFNRFPEEMQRHFARHILALCEAVFVVDPELQLYVPQAIIVPRVIRLPALVEPTETSEYITVVHAPSRRSVKGTKFVKRAIKELQQEGRKVKLKLVEDVKHSEAIKHYQQADIIVDQLRIGWYGVLSVEAMALGKPVVCYIKDDLKHHLPHPSPIINASPETIKDVLRELIQDKGLRDQAGVRGRVFAEETHDVQKVVRQLERLYAFKSKTINALPLMSWTMVKDLEDARPVVPSSSNVSHKKKFKYNFHLVLFYLKNAGVKATFKKIFKVLKKRIRQKIEK